MPKRCVALFFVLLLVFCACGKTGTDEPDTTAAATEPTVTKPAVPVEFSLPELPDIGSYQSKKAPEPFFDAPLKDFKESADYGAIIPYQLISNTHIKACGFMTTDGKIITAPIYSSVEPVVSEDSVVYLVKYRTQYFTPGKKKPTPEEDSYTENYKAVSETEYFQLITGDGKKMVTLPVGMTPYYFSDTETEEKIICCNRSVEKDDAYFETIRFYDLALNPLPELGEYRSEANKFSAVIAKNDSGLWLFENSVYLGEEIKRQQRVLCYRNGRLQRSVELEKDETISAVAGDLLVGARDLYTLSGKEILSYSWENFVCDAKTNYCFAIDSKIEKLVKIKNGEVVKSVALPETEDIALDEAVSNGKTCLLVSCSFEDETQKKTLYDMDLNVLCTLPPDSKTVRTATMINDYGDIRYGPVLYYWNYENGKAALYSLSGELLASQVEKDMDAKFQVTNKTVCYADKFGGVTVYDPESGSVLQQELSFPYQKGELLFQNGKILVWSCDLNDSDHWRRNGYQDLIFDLKTGDVLYENITEFNLLDLGDQQYCAFLCGGQSYICDSDLNVIAEIPDGYYA